uniref:Uncharacterized protein n=1 Tax=Anguilla anguilla TaxID=7936 RepID=A0A0E9UUD4_ANGAN
MVQGVNGKPFIYSRGVHTVNAEKCTSSHSHVRV